MKNKGNTNVFITMKNNGNTNVFITMKNKGNTISYQEMLCICQYKAINKD